MTTFREKLMALEAMMTDLDAEIVVEHVEGKTRVILLPRHAPAVSAMGWDMHEALGALYDGVRAAVAAA